MTSGEVARRVGVTSVTVRSWADKGILVPHHVSPTGYRYFSEQDVQEFLHGMVKKAEVQNVAG